MSLLPTHRPRIEVLSREFIERIIDEAFEVNATLGLQFENPMALQILADHGQPPRKFTAGSLYDVVAPTRNMSRPAGQWNEVRVDCQGRRIQVALGVHRQ